MRDTEGVLLPGFSPKTASSGKPANAAAIAALSPIDVPTQAELNRMYDVVLLGGRVVNPETGLDREGLNVAISGGTIELVTDREVKGRRTIDARGLVVAPGFIDNLSYDPNPLGVWTKLADGVTSNIAMHGGTASPEKWYSYYSRIRTPLNFGASFFYTQARNRLEIGRYEPANPVQGELLAEQAERALNEGALGISFSLEYVPGIGPSEIVPLMRLAYEYNVPVYFHARYSDMEEPGTNLEAIQELIGYAEKTGASVHVDHINSTGGTFSMKQSLDMLAEAREKGLDLTACTYPYDYWGTYLNSARFDEGWQQRFRITYNDLQIAGTPERLTEPTFKEYRRQGKLAVAYAIPEQDIVDSLSSPFVMIGSDAILEPGLNNHPRASGTFARTIGLYSREHAVLPLIDAVGKMTLLPARRLEKQAPSLRRKGRLARGMDADIVIFDYESIRDRSTVEKPDLPSQGIRYVLVGGKIALDGNGMHKSVPVGQPIRSEFVRYEGAAGLLELNQEKEKSFVPIVSYRGEDYVDLAVLQAFGSTPSREEPGGDWRLQQGAGRSRNVPEAGAAGPGLRELMLERGHRLKWEEGSAELLSIGDRDYVGLETLGRLGIALARSVGGWTASVPQ
ncbi:amidohydrolase family protein [Cohnella fermenti]|uniref:amidohydrolase family protein n=1 Tax=Cohnella fermenti TaxID=2565925 RepID=UPI001E5783AB|nr:amidohydrolase family protein [Cohnella fermenti]